MKLGSWVIMLTAMAILLTIFGIDSGISALLDLLNITTTSIDVKTSIFYLTITSAFAVIGLAGAIIVGVFAKSYDVSLIILPIVVFILGQYITLFVSIVNLASATGSDWLTYIVVFIFGSMMAGFVMSCVDYFAGR